MEKPRNISDAVGQLLEPVINTLGYRVWDVEYVKEGANMYLRVTIDKDGTIDIDDCEKVHRGINTILDENDPIPDAYILEVSSPGVERTLRRREHFEYAMGKEVSVKLFAPDDNGKKEYNGTVTAYGDGVLTLETTEGTVKIGMSSVAKANTVFDFRIN